MRARFIFEQFDDPELKKRVGQYFDKDLLKDLVKNEPYKNRYETGSYHGKDSAKLNDLVNRAMDKGKYTEIDAQGFAEVAYRLLVKEIPELKSWTVQHGGGGMGSNPVHHINVQKEVLIPDPEDKLDRPFQAEVNLWITFIAEPDEILDYQEGKLKILLSMNVRSQTKGGLLWDIGKDSKKWGDKKTKFKPGKGGCKGEDCEINFDDAENEEELDKLMNKMQDVMYGQPDKQDEKISKDLEISERNISLEEFDKLLPQIKENIRDYNYFLKAKYDIAI